jgi:protein SCO1/2
MPAPDRVFPLALCLIALLPAALKAQSENIHKHHMAPSSGGLMQPVDVSGLTIPDITLIDQHGNKVRFYSDLVKGRLVAINTIFTTCTTICPMMGANFSKLRKLLGEDVGAKVRLISISIDPVVDTPERLDQWSKGFGQVEPGWTLLTGPKEDVDSLLKALSVFTAEKLDHSPVVLVGGAGAGNWARASALLPPSRLAELIQARLMAGTPPKL